MLQMEREMMITAVGSKQPIFVESIPSKNGYILLEEKDSSYKQVLMKPDTLTPYRVKIKYPSNTPGVYNL